MQIRSIKTNEEFDEIKDEWIKFEAEAKNKNISTSYLWQRTWWKHFSNSQNGPLLNKKELLILLLYDNATLRAIAPFCIIERPIKLFNHYKSLEFISQQWGATYLDFISSELRPEEISFIFSYLKQNCKYDIINLQHIPQFTKIFNLNSKSAFPLSGCPEIENLNYETISGNYSKNVRQNIRTALNKIAKRNIKIESIVTTDYNFDLLNEIESVSYSKLVDGKHSIYLDKTKKDFLQDVFSTMNLNCVQIRFDNLLVAYRLNFIYNNFKYCFDASFDRNYREFNLGLLSVDLNIRDSCSRKLEYHCMGSGIQPYKLNFTKKICYTYEFMLKGNTFMSGILFLWKYILKMQRTNFLLRKIKRPHL